MSKTRRARYTLEFKLEAVRLVKAGQSVAAVAVTLGVPAQSISCWVKAEQEGELGGEPVQSRSVRSRWNCRDFVPKWLALRWSTTS